MEQVQEGVANFRDFQETVKAYIVRSDERELQKEKKDARRAKIHYALLSGLIAAIVAVLSWLLSFVQTHHMTAIW